MKRTLAIFNTDQVNRYGYRFTTEALESCLSQAWRGTPMFISHDYHRPIGISRPLALHLHARQVSLMGLSMLPEGDGEVEAVKAFAQLYLARKLGDVDESDEERLGSRLSGHLSASAAFMARECVSVVDPGIARRALPELFQRDETDKLSLIPIRDLTAIGPGVFEVEGYAVFAHRYFRRAHSQINNLNGIFLEKLYGLKGDQDLDVKIALDADSIGLADTYRTPIELEYWRGPKFDDDLSKIQMGVARYKATERERMFYGIDITDFWWHERDGMYSLECEELRDTPTVACRDETYGCRYVHSIVDEATKLPNHLDGAIREYDGNSFLERIDVDISKAGANSRYVKLWRIDGRIELPKWKELICDFYRDNRQPGEYLMGARLPDGHGEDAPSEGAPSGGQVRLTPPFVAEEDSVHVAVSYHSRDDFAEVGDCSVMSFQHLVVGGRRLNVIEFSAMDLIKSVGKRISGKIALPAGVSYVAFEDLDINFPLFLFNGTNARDDADQALCCLIDLCHRFVADGTRRFVTASFGLYYGEVMAMFSFAGFASSLVDVFDGWRGAFPTSFDSVGQWCEACRDRLQTVGGASRLTGDAQDMLHVMGGFSFSRSFAIAGLISLDGNGRPCVRLPREAGAVAQALHSGALQLMPVVLVNECQCQKCGASYFCCECSTFTEEECSVSMTQCEPLGCFLTERPAFPGPRFEAPRPEDAVDPESDYCQSFAPPPP